MQRTCSKVSELAREVSVSEVLSPDEVARLVDEIAGELRTLVRSYPEAHDEAYRAGRRGEPFPSIGASGSMSDPSQHTAIGPKGELPEWRARRRQTLESISSTLEQQKTELQSFNKTLRGRKPRASDVADTPTAPPSIDAREYEELLERQRRRQEGDDT